MDCCNCLPYRAQYFHHSPHQQYYHHQHDPLPPYPQQPDYSFHHPQMYRHDYYGGPTGPYYDPQHWAQPSGFGLPQGIYKCMVCHKISQSNSIKINLQKFILVHLRGCTVQSSVLWARASTGYKYCMIK
ncbi:unnamed protein product [Acanthoscelides obtectus]|uniref:Uncharacterized protein n=1 Tax=Acanthoscelides obtectus TaxID=200917 RepID=A0A9P0NSK9_ACAOB|nr:unnamed protein product [Acanthoscelides obtectus]CAK1639767.1 hypothetical protein AOBTE_LOCUS11362 [Acanthoscelides obtectus]